MLIKFETPNGHMEIVAETFFPATKKDMKKLKKAIVNQEDLQKVADGIGNLIEQLETFANDSKARMEIHQMSLLEEIKGTFKYKAIGRKIAFYHSEYLRANEQIAALKENKEALDG